MEIQCFAAWAQDSRRPALSHMSPYGACTVRHHPSVLVPLVTLQYDRLAHKNVFIGAFTGSNVSQPHCQGYFLFPGILGKKGMQKSHFVWLF